MYWNGWPLARVLLLVTSTMFFVVFAQVTLFHYRQNFRHFAMWSPVLEAPILGALTLISVFYLPAWLVPVLNLTLGAGVLSGLAGTYYHVRGVGERVGGYHLNNFLIGPPVGLPLTLSAVSVLGLLALNWG